LARDERDEIEIYAASVRDTMQQARQQTASRSLRGFNGGFEP